MQIVYLNGELMPLAEARLPVLDRGFIFGDGVYEVIPVYGRAPFRLAGHLARLARSLDAIRLANPHPDAAWAKLIDTLIAQHEWEDQSVYIQITRGAAPRDHRMPADAVPTVFMMASRLNRPSDAERAAGVSAISLEDNRWLRCNVKSTALLGNILLRQQAADAGAAECVLFRDGYLTEASASNVFVVKGGTLLAPPADNLILAGITYEAVIELAREHNLPLELRRIAQAEVRAADELWLTSSSKEVLPVTKLDGRPVGDGRPGPVWKRMFEWFCAATRAGGRTRSHV